MPRQTRQERRERREAQADSAQQRAPRARVQPAAASPVGELSGAQQHGFGPVRFVRESAGELKKVDWPGQQQLIQGTVVVLAACIIVGFYLWANDKLWQYVVHHILLK